MTSVKINEVILPLHILLIMGFKLILGLCFVTVAKSFPTLVQFQVLRRRNVQLSAISEETQKLLDQAAKARAEAAALEADLARTRVVAPSEEVKKAPEIQVPSRTIPPVSQKKAISSSDLTQKLGVLNFDDAKSATSVLDKLREEGFCTRWNCADLGEVWAVSQGQLKQQAGIDSKSLNIDMNLDDLKYALGAVVAFSAVSAVLSGVVIGGNTGATFTYIFAILPILFLGIGSSSPGIIVAAINLFKIRFDSEFQSRRVHHEAAHFLAGYLCGLPVKSYTIDGATTQIEFFDTLEGDQANLGRMLNRFEIDPLSVVALAGAVAEVKKFGSATGSAQDLDSLGRLMNRTTPPMKDRDQEEQTRWAALTAHRLLNRYKKEFDAVIVAFSERKSVIECIAALESA